jgi:hypothetical protein
VSDSILNQPENLVGLFGRHLVGFVFRVADAPRSVDSYPNRQIVLSCVLLRVRTKDFLLTAGHSLRDIEYAISRGLFHIKSALLADIFGYQRRTNYPIPYAFDLGRCHHAVDDQRGLDIGLIELDKYYVDLIKANGVLPIEEVNWAQQHQISFNMYFALGFPSQLNPGENPQPGQTTLSPVLVPVRGVPELPQDLLRPNDERFWGKLPDDLPIDFDGMSGGPIFGVRMKPRIEYWIIAIQNAWYSHRKLIVGNRVPTIGWLLEWAIDQSTASNIDIHDPRL